MGCVTLSNIDKRYGDKVLFDKFNLTIEKGEFVSITGASGSGKSTLLNILGLLEKPDSGTISIFGKNNPSIYRTDGQQLLRSHISYLFQNYGLIDNETVSYNLLISLRFQKLSKSEQKVVLAESLTRVGLAGFEQKKIYQLSGGEQQRVALAKIILKKADLILADEPTGSLDDVNKHNVLAILQELHMEGKTIVIVTHDEEVNQCAQRSIKI